MWQCHIGISNENETLTDPLIGYRNLEENEVIGKWKIGGFMEDLTFNNLAMLT